MLRETLATGRDLLTCDVLPKLAEPIRQVTKPWPINRSTHDFRLKGSDLDADRDLRQRLRDIKPIADVMLIEGWRNGAGTA